MAKDVRGRQSSPSSHELLQRAVLQAVPRPNRATALELLERALLAGKRLDDVDLLQKGFALAWSVALPLLESLPPDERGGVGSARTPHASALANAEAYHHAALPPTDPHAPRARGRRPPRCGG